MSRTEVAAPYARVEWAKSDPISGAVEQADLTKQPVIVGVPIEIQQMPVSLLVAPCNDSKASDTVKAVPEC
jgi:hypothetical protein